MKAEPAVGHQILNLLNLRRTSTYRFYLEDYRLKIEGDGLRYIPVLL